MLLVGDNCAAQHLDSLKNIHLEFISAKTTSLVLSMNMGIVNNLKTLHRAKLVNNILEIIEENLPTSPSAIGLYFISCRKAMEAVIHIVWRIYAMQEL
jgi:hypothetical protein